MSTDALTSTPIGTGINPRIFFVTMLPRTAGWTETSSTKVALTSIAVLPSSVSASKVASAFTASWMPSPKCNCSPLLINSTFNFTSSESSKLPPRFNTWMPASVCSATPLKKAAASSANPLSSTWVWSCCSRTSFSSSEIRSSPETWISV